MQCSRTPLGRWTVHQALSIADRRAYTSRMAGRRIAGMLVALLMLHLNLVQADVPCASRGIAHGSGVMTPPARSMQMVRHRHEATDHHQRHDKPCDTPTHADCCQALTSCSLLIGHGASKQFAAIPPAHERVLAGLAALPLSPIVSPDPPPPRA